MNDTMKYIIDLLVMVVVAFPPFLYLDRYVNARFKNILLKSMIFIFYWGLTVLFSSLIPSITVLFLIRKSRIKSSRTDEAPMVASGIPAEGDGLKRAGLKRPSERFELDCTGDGWKFSLKVFIITALIGIPIKILVSYANSLVVYLLELLKIPLQNQEVVNEFLQAGLWGSIFYFILIVFCAPIAEEFVFRFWLYDRVLKSRTGKIISAVFSSLLFMAAHFNIQGAAAFFLVGLINCYLYDKKGYWAAVANHFMFNFSSAVLLLAVKYLHIPLNIT